MICPFCKLDYKDVEDGEIPGGVIRVDDNFYKTYRRIGRRCTNCGKIAEFIEKATGDEFFKRPIIPNKANLKLQRLKSQKRKKVNR